MAKSIHIRQDLYNFERKRKGFTTRQLVALFCAAGVCIGIVALLGYVLEIDYTVALSIALVFAMIVASAGFLPIWNMPAEVWYLKLSEINKRGNTIVWRGEVVPEMKGVTSREYRKKKKKQGYEAA